MAPPKRFSPYSRWLEEILRQDIAQRVYKPGGALPAAHQLMHGYNLSNTSRGTLKDCFVAILRLRGTSALAGGARENRRSAQDAPRNDRRKS